MPAKVLVGADLFKSNAKYIVHQCNCITWASAHLAGDVFRHFPWADIYTPRKGTDYQDVPGTILVRGNGQDKRFVIAILGQFYPGKPRFPQSAKDGYAARIDYFASGLRKIVELPDLDSISFPWGVGCGAAGGNWEIYHGLIDEFADKVAPAEVTICKLE